MNRIKTGTIILAGIALIFGVDAVLSFNEVPTISEWFSEWLHSGWSAVLIYCSVFVLLSLHFWWFRPKDKNSGKKNNIGAIPVGTALAIGSLVVSGVIGYYAGNEKSFQNVSQNATKIEVIDSRVGYLEKDVLEIKQNLNLLDDISKKQDLILKAIDNKNI